MQLHAAFMRLFYGKGQWVVAGVFVVLPCQTYIPRFNLTGVDNSAPDTCLHKNGVYLGSLQLIQKLAELLPLLFAFRCRCGFNPGPIQPA